MSETGSTRGRKRRQKLSEETLELAEAIAVEVVQTSSDATDTDSAEIEAHNSVSNKTPQEESVAEPEAPALDLPTLKVEKRAQKMVRVKAIATVRGQYGNFIYDIKQGEVYNLPEAVAQRLIDKGRAI